MVFPDIKKKGDFIMGIKIICNGFKGAFIGRLKKKLIDEYKSLLENNEGLDVVVKIVQSINSKRLDSAWFSGTVIEVNINGRYNCETSACGLLEGVVYNNEDDCSFKKEHTGIYDPVSDFGITTDKKLRSAIKRHTCDYEGNKPCVNLSYGNWFEDYIVDTKTKKEYSCGTDCVYYSLDDFNLGSILEMIPEFIGGDDSYEIK